jgi:hypothetical protein
MANNITSQSPFKGKPNRRAGAGPVYNTFNTPPKVPSGRTQRRKTVPEQNPCFGPYDNATNYVWEVDLDNGNHLAYVDCDYV